MGTSGPAVLGQLGPSEPRDPSPSPPAGTPGDRQRPALPGGWGTLGANWRPPVAGAEGDTLAHPSLWAAKPPPRGRGTQPRTAPSLTVCARSGLRAAPGGSAAMDTAIMARATAGAAGQGPPIAGTPAPDSPGTIPRPQPSTGGRSGTDAAGTRFTRIRGKERGKSAQVAFSLFNAERVSVLITTHTRG